MSRITVMLTTWALVGCLNSLAWAEPAEGTRSGTAVSSLAVLLEKGIYTEETVGDIDKAIEIYQDVV